MIRDWNLIRNLLIRIETDASPGNRLQLFDFSADQQEAIAYHGELLIEAGLVQGPVYHDMDGAVDVLQFKRLTWEGHECLDKIRSESIWNKTKDWFRSNGIEMTIDLVRKVSVKFMTDQLAN